MEPKLDTATAGDISERVWICWHNDQPYEDTSTLVLSAPSSAFVDIRLLKPTLPSDSPLPNTGGPADRLEWAFSGISVSSVSADGAPHKKWIHLIDSKCAYGEKPAEDEGDMLPQTDDPRLCLEKGKMKHPVTGVVTEYKELWKSLVPIAVADEKLRHCVVISLDDPAHKARGIVIRVGQFCQALLMIDQVVDLERWVWYDDGSIPHSPEKARSEASAATTTVGGWVRVAKLGSRFLPCSFAFKTEMLVEGNTLKYGDMEWTVKEKYAW